MTIQEKFNQKDTLLIVSDFPEKTKHGEKNYGIAWYTKETLEPIVKKYNRKFIVLAEKDGDNSPKLLLNGKILLLRVFDPKHHSLFPVILKWLLTFDKIDRVFIHSEFCTNGGIKNFALLPLFLLLIKLSGKKITYFCHNVITDFSDFTGHLNLPKNKNIIFVLNQALKIYYYFLGLLAEKIVVMDRVMQKRIGKYVNEDKVEFVPIWVKQKRYHLNKNEAKKSLEIKKSDFVVLYFGFVTWYKGADWLIKNFKKMNGKNLRLIIAGGPTCSLKGKKYYQIYYKKQVDEVKKDERILLTGFVPEREIGRYFTASDLVVFPYRYYLGSSGVLSHTLSYRKPFIVSRKMEEIFGNKDLSRSLDLAGISKSDLIFDFDKKSLADILAKLQKNKKLTKLARFSRILAEKRSCKLILPLLYERIFLGKTLVSEEALEISYANIPAQS